MATLTKEQIEQKKQLLAEKMKEMKAIYDKLVEAGAIALGSPLATEGTQELSEDELGKAAGGHDFEIVDSHWEKPVVDKKPEEDRMGIAYDPVWGKPIKVKI